MVGRSNGLLDILRTRLQTLAIMCLTLGFKRVYWYQIPSMMCLLISVLFITCGTILIYIDRAYYVLIGVIIIVFGSPICCMSAILMDLTKCKHRALRREIDSCMAEHIHIKDICLIVTSYDSDTPRSMKYTAVVYPV